VGLAAVLEGKLERCATLPTLPAAALKIVQLCQRENVPVPDLVAAVSADPALSAKVLKLVNSAALGRRQEVRTLSHAVILLGTNALQALALSFSLVPGPRGRTGAARQAFWRRAVTSAIAARELAITVEFPLSEEAFLCGLLQDLGMLALTQVLAAEYEDLLTQAGGDNEALAALERARLGTDHAEVGAWLLGRWKLPAVMCRAAELSHSPSRLPPGTEAESAALIRITATAGLLADIWLRPDVASATVRAKVRTRGLFELSDAMLQALVSRIAAAAPDIAALFDIDLGDPDDLAAVVEQAKEALVMLNLRASEQVAEARQTIRALEHRTEALAREAEHDPLTGLHNRRSLERRLDEELSIALDARTPLSVVVGDVDFFKRVNDTYGHGVGDRVLEAVATALSGQVRPRDTVARYGGEEFVAVLPATPAAGAAAVAERFRSQVEALELAVGDGPVVRMTMSFGHATASAGHLTSSAELLRAADEALYAAKRAGRNRVMAHAPAPSAPGAGRA
jgi:diguanylate cyclase (GGDEF)-like protein